MSDPAWAKYVKWPACSDCNASGVRVDPKTKWPEECQRCLAGRKNAIKSAQNYRRRALKSGEILE